MPAMPASLRAAVGILIAEAAVLAVLVAILIYEDVAAAAASAGSALALTAFTALMAALLGWLGWALARRYGWARGPAIVLQLLLLPIGYTLATGGAPGFGVPAIIAGLAGAGALLAPTTRAAINRQ